MTPKKITDSIEALSLIQKYKITSTLTNCYLLGSEIERLVSENRLQYIVDDANVFFLEDKTNCYRIHYMINNPEKEFFASVDKPLMLEILFRGHDGIPEDAVRYWEKQGFKRNLVRKNLTAKYTDLLLATDCVSDVHVAESESEGEFSRSLFNSSFDPYSGDYISKENISELTKQGQILIALKDGTYSGALHFYNIGKCAWIGHVAVCSHIRGLGIGKTLVSEFIRVNHTDDKSRYALWVQEQNKAAVAMYERFGFKYAGKSSLSMIKESN